MVGTVPPSLIFKGATPQTSSMAFSSALKYGDSSEVSHQLAEWVMVIYVTNSW